ncbi:MAG: endonuclease/exonuclease/phosphatase family protein [Bacteroidia bacterium]
MARVLLFITVILQMELGAQKNITVMFYNVENFFDYSDDPKTQDEEFLPNSTKKWDEKKYDNKIQRIAQVLDSSVKGIELPDIVGFCEIENIHVLTDLITKSQLKAKKYTSLCTTGQDTRGINVGIIYDKTLFDFVSYKELDAVYPALPNNKTRNILFITLKFKATHEEVYILVNHWPSRRDGEKETEPRRLHAAKVARAQIDEILKTNKDAKIILMGDLNDTPKNYSVLNILKANSNPNKDNDELLNPYFNFEKIGDGTHIDQAEWHVFDNIILSTAFMQNKGLSFKPNSAFILKKDFVLFKNYKTGFIKPNRTYGGDKYFNGYSDHLAVYITLYY